MNIELVTQIALLLNKVETLEDAKAISGELNRRWREIQRKKAAEIILTKGFLPGATVKFSTRGRTVVGKVEHINRKTVSVIPASGGPHWRVSPGLLKEATAEEFEKAAKTAGLFLTSTV